jgi:hypothetical protein
MPVRRMYRAGIQRDRHPRRVPGADVRHAGSILATVLHDVNHLELETASVPQSVNAREGLHRPQFGEDRRGTRKPSRLVKRQGRGTPPARQ